MRMPSNNARRGSGEAATTQVSFRLPTEWLARADEIARRLSEDARPMSRTDALRIAISRGFAVLEKSVVDRAASPNKRR